jgi:type I restriction enzyme S subunit
MAGEWRPITLGEVLSFANGKASPERSASLGSPVYGSNGIIGFAGDTNAPENTIVIGRVGSYCGSLYLSREKCWVTDNAIRATALDENDARFLFYLLSTLDLNRWRAGSGQPLLNQTILSQIPASVPLPDEQRAIANILGTLDDKIELNRRLNETVEAMARALFKSWFVDFDPVRAKAEGRDPGLPKHLADLFPASFEDSELGEIPRGWKTGSLGEIAENPRRGIQPSAVSPSTPYIGLEHMPRQSIALSEWGEAGSVESNKSEFKRGEILFGKLRPYFHKVGVAPTDGVCSTDILVARPKEQHWFGFVLGHMSSASFVGYTNAGSTGTKMPRTNWDEMSRYPLVLPMDDVAVRFNCLIGPLVDRIIIGIHESKGLVATRDKLLPKLISGELRVENTACIVGEST